MGDAIPEVGEIRAGPRGVTYQAKTTGGHQVLAAGA